MKNSVEYVFAWRGPYHYEVAKFDGTKQPVAVYTIRGKDWHCNCWGAIKHGKCHHPDMVRGWVSKGRQIPECFGRVETRWYGKTYGQRMERDFRQVAP